MRCRSVPNAGAALRSDRRRLRRGAWRRFWPWKDDARLKTFKTLATDGSAPARTTPIAGSDALLIAYYNTLYQTYGLPSHATAATGENSDAVETTGNRGGRPMVFGAAAHSAEFGRAI